MADSNKALGNRFEDRFCKILAEHGFWVHRMQQSQAGQPADVVACRNGKPYLIDCKVAMSNRFPFSRIEYNQHSAMNLWRRRVNNDVWFAIQLNDNSIYMVNYISIKAMQEEPRPMSSMNESQIRGYHTIEEWLKRCQ